MSIIDASFQRDSNRVPITSYGLTVSKTVAFDGAAGNGAQGTVALFTVTGDVIVRVVGSCTETLVSASGTIAVGSSGNTAVLLSAVTASALAAGDAFVFGTTPAQIGSLSGTGTAATPYFIVGGADIIATIATADITDGTLVMYCLWSPVSSDGNVVAA